MKLTTRCSRSRYRYPGSGRTPQEARRKDQLWTRVWRPAKEDLTRRRIYAGDPSSDDAAYVDDREDLEPLFIGQWLSHVAPDLHLHAIGALGEKLKKIEAPLDSRGSSQVREPLVGQDRQSLRVTRQGARKRWDSQMSGQEIGVA